MIDHTSAAYVLLFGRLILGLVFGLSGVTKVADLAGFIASLREFRLLPERAVKPVALGITAAEVSVAAALLAGVAVEGAAGAATALLTVFTFALARVLRRGQRIACRCFGELSAGPASWRTVLRNILLIALSIATLALTADLATSGITAGDTIATGLLATGTLATLPLVTAATSLARIARTLPRGEGTRPSVRPSTAALSRNAEEDAGAPPQVVPMDTVDKRPVAAPPVRYTGAVP